MFWNNRVSDVRRGAGVTAVRAPAIEKLESREMMSVSLTHLVAINSAPVVNPGVYVTLNPQPLPPGSAATINPQPLPPKIGVIVFSSFY